MLGEIVDGYQLAAVSQLGYEVRLKDDTGPKKWEGGGLSGDSTEMTARSE